MARTRAAFAPLLHAEADRFEPRLRRAYVRSMERLRSRVPLGSLVAAIQAGNVKRALALVSKELVADALQPCADIVADAVIRGGKVGAAMVKKVRRAA